MHIKLVAMDLALFFAWQKRFQDCPDVEVIDGDILAQHADALVSPANSFGYMDGGLDLKISQQLGWDIERRVREKILQDHHGELPVGCATIIETGVDYFPYLISAPTMRVPMNVSSTVNAYLAFRAILMAVKKANTIHPVIRTIACPGLGTGEGQMQAEQCAIQMREAYDVCIGGKRLINGGLAAAVTNQQYLLASCIGA